MAVKHKRGATSELEIQFSEEEWAEIHPWESIEADIGQGAVKHDTIITSDEVTRTILISAETNEWSLGAAKMDIRIVKNGRTKIIPSDSTIKFSVIDAITTGETA